MLRLPLQQAIFLRAALPFVRPLVVSYLTLARSQPYHSARSYVGLNRVTARCSRLADRFASKSY